MEKSSAARLLTSVDSLFTTQEERDVAKQPRVQEIPIDQIDDFPNHPFKVRMDENMEHTAESVKQYGVLVPAIVRPKEDGRYEMVSGHRRKVACSLIVRQSMPCIVRDLTTEDCTPSHVQAMKMRKFSEEGRLNMDVIFFIMQEEKPNQKEQFKIPRERISKYFAPGTPAQKIEDTIIKALEFYRKRQREQER